tara:strand:- start:1493 stop:1954 length:462 start_codon:yes stop_codon:yes gene_type:complete
MSKYDKLKKLTINNIGLFTLNNKTTIGKVIQVNSPEDFQMIIGLDNVMFRFHCRLSKSKIISDKKINYINKFIDLVTDCSCSNNELSDIELQKLVDKNEKLLNVKCGNFDINGNLLVELYEFNNKVSVQESLTDLKILEKIDDNEGIFKFNST